MGSSNIIKGVSKTATKSMTTGKGFVKGVTAPNTKLKGANKPFTKGFKSGTQVRSDVQKTAKSAWKTVKKNPGTSAVIGGGAVATGAGGAMLYNRRSSHGGIDHSSQQHWNG